MTTGATMTYTNPATIAGFVFKINLVSRTISGKNLG